MSTAFVVIAAVAALIAWGVILWILWDADRRRDDTYTGRRPRGRE